MRRAKPLEKNLQRLQQYAAEIGDNNKKLRMFMSEFGRGICTASSIDSGQAVCEYVGKVMSKSAAVALAKLYAVEGKGSYIFDLKLNDGRTVSIDATAEDGRPGRLINHSYQKGNLKPKLIVTGESIRLFLVARETIPANRELLYDYGDRSLRAQKFLRESPSPKDVTPSSFCGDFCISQVLVPGFDNCYCNISAVHFMNGMVSTVCWAILTKSNCPCNYFD
jgi:hypothetical protein